VPTPARKPYLISNIFFLTHPLQWRRETTTNYHSNTTANVSHASKRNTCRTTWETTSQEARTCCCWQEVVVETSVIRRWWSVDESNHCGMLQLWLGFMFVLYFIFLFYVCCCVYVCFMFDFTFFFKYWFVLCLILWNKWLLLLKWKVAVDLNNISSHRRAALVFSRPDQVELR